MTTLSVFYPGVVIPVVSPISDGLNPVSTVMTVDWNVSTRISTTKTFQWDIPQYRISATKAAEFNTKTRIHKVTGFESVGLVRPISWPFVYYSFVPAISWDADGRISTTKNFSWDNKTRISSKKAIQFNILNYLFASEKFRFNDLKAVYVPGYVPPTWHNQVAQPVTHPISDATGQAASYFEWNVKYRTHTSKTSRFNTRFATKVQKAFAFNDLALAVICQKAIEFHTYGEVNPELASSWHMGKRFYARRATAWETRHTLSKQLATQWRVTNPVTKQLAFQYKTVQRLKLYKSAKFNFYKLTRARLPVEFHTLLHVVVRDWHLQSNSPSFLTTGIVHPIDYSNRSGITTVLKGLCEPVVQPLDASVYPGSGQTATPGIQFRVGINPSGRVQCQQAIEFNDLGDVKVRQQSTWNLVDRMGKAILVSFSIYNYVVADMPTSWVTGAGTSSQIRQTAQVRTDFSY